MIVSYNTVSTFLWTPSTDVLQPGNELLHGDVHPRGLYWRPLRIESQPSSAGMNRAEGNSGRECAIPVGQGQLTLFPREHKCYQEEGAKQKTPNPWHSIAATLCTTYKLLRVTSHGTQSPSRKTWLQGICSFFLPMAAVAYKAIPVHAHTSFPWSGSIGVAGWWDLLMSAGAPRVGVQQVGAAVLRLPGSCPQLFPLCFL